MDKTVIYSKTAKGMNESRNGGKNLVREHARVLSLINGTSTVGDLLASGGLIAGKYESALQALVEHGLIRVFEASKQHEPVLNWSAAPAGADDFTDALPTLVVEELSPQESVEVWAQAQRGASALKKTGFYSYGNKKAAPGKTALTALVVEDDDELAELLVMLLAEKGIVVQRAADLPAAMAAVQHGAAPDLVLLDIVLPGQAGKDGFDVLDAIRRKADWRRVPVVMVTSEVSDDQVMKGLKAGADGYIFKPFKWEALYSCIQNVVGM
jgi:CheY-like chemotaxis protein